MATERTTGITLASKFVSEIKTFAFDFTNKLASGDSIGSITSVTITNQSRVSGSTNITVDNQAAGTTSASIRFSGGTAGELYRVDVLIATAVSSESLLIPGFIEVLA